MGEERQQAKHRHDLELHLLPAMRHLFGQRVQLEVEDADPDDGRHHEDRPWRQEARPYCPEASGTPGSALSRAGWMPSTCRDRSWLHLAAEGRAGAGSDELSGRQSTTDVSRHSETSHRCRLRQPDARSVYVRAMSCLQRGHVSHCYRARARPLRGSGHCGLPRGVRRGRSPASRSAAIMSCASAGWTFRDARSKATRLP